MCRYLLLLDFDGTITQEDTLDSLVTLAISAAPSHLDDAPTSTTNPTDHDTTTKLTTRQQSLTALWTSIVNDYVAAHAAHAAQYAPAACDRTTLDQELAWLESLASVEAASVARVSRGGFFRGLGGDEGEGGVKMRRLGRDAVSRPGAGGGGGATFYGTDEDGGGGVGAGKGAGTGSESRGGTGVGTGSSAEKGGGGGGSSGKEDVKGETHEEEQKECLVKLRRGFPEFLEKMGSASESGSEGKWDLAVVSINWSGDFISGVVEGGCGTGQKIRRVVANAVRYGGQIEGPAELGEQPLVTANDKLRAMNSLREGMEDEKVVYFGDSTTDMACLLAADLGVVMANDDESKLLKTLKRVGIEVPHVGEAGAESTLVWARDFAEVMHTGIVDRIE